MWNKMICMYTGSLCTCLALSGVPQKNESALI